MPLHPVAFLILKRSDPTVWLALLPKLLPTLCGSLSGLCRSTLARLQRTTTWQ
jgi:hypothetical protein